MREPEPSTGMKNSFLWAFAKDLIAGTVGGTAGIVAGQPADTVKVRVQSAPTAESTIAVASRMLHKEGPAAFFRGIFAPLLANAPINAIVFSVYGGVVRQIISQTGQQPSLVQQFMSGAAGGAAQSIVACPSELIKIQQQIAMTDFVPAKKGPERTAPAKPARAIPNAKKVLGVRTLHVGRVCAATALKAASQSTSWELMTSRIYKAGLTRGAFQGLNATLLRDVPAFGAYFFSYELFKLKIEKIIDPVSRVRVTWWETSFPSFMAGGIAGVVSWTLTMPMDVVKSHIQSQPLDGPKQERAWLPVARRGYAKEGTSYFFRGTGPALLRAFPVSAVVFSVYEWVTQQLEKLERPYNSAVRQYTRSTVDFETGWEHTSESGSKSYRMSALERELGLPPLHVREYQSPFGGKRFGPPDRLSIEKRKDENHDDEKAAGISYSDEKKIAVVAKGSDYIRSEQEVALGLPPLRAREYKD